MTVESQGPELRFDEDQIRALIDLEAVTKKSLGHMIREGLDMYIKVNRGEAVYHPAPETLFSPIVFDTPERKYRED